MINTLLFIFIVIAVHYFIFLLRIYGGLKKLAYEKKSPEKPEPVFNKVSIIIPFRNEEANIINSLNSILAQDFPTEKLEVIYVNDCSTDKSLEILSAAVNKSHIKVISVPEHYSENQNKKRAVRYGIENSTGDIIITTDADCIHPKAWLSIMLSSMDKETGFVSGPVIFMDENNSFNRFQKIEFAGLVLTGAGLIGSGNPIICNAANIAYRKDAFNEVGGFSYKHTLSSGDDELLMQKIKKETNWKIKFCMNKEALVQTAANKNISEFYNQRKRWASKGLFYSDKALIIKLVLIFFFYLSLPLLFIAGFFEPIFFISFVLIFIIKIAIEYMIMKLGTKILFPASILKNFFTSELLHIPYIIIAGASGVLGNYQWKDRKIKR